MSKTNRLMETGGIVCMMCECSLDHNGGCRMNVEKCQYRVDMIKKLREHFHELYIGMLPKKSNCAPDDDLRYEIKEARNEIIDEINKRMENMKQGE